MIEAMSYELSEDEMGQCFDMASVEITKWEDFQKKLSAEFGKEKLIFPKIQIESSVIEIFNEKVKSLKLRINPTLL